MADLNVIRAAVAVLLDGVPNLQVAQEFPDQIVPPQVVIGLPEAGEYYPTIAPGDRINFDLPMFVYVQRAQVRPAQRLLMDLISTGTTLSIPDVLKADITLGDTVDSSMLREFRDLGKYEVANTDYLGAELILEVISKRA